jgi:hypothetical protein
MEKDRSNQEQFIEYLDRLLAGEDVTVGDEVSDEVRSALEFARMMLASRDEPSYAFRTRLRERLVRRLAEEDGAAPAALPVRKGFAEWMQSLFPRRVVWRTVASTAIVVLLVAIVTTVWYTGKQVPAPTAPTTPAAPAPSVPEAAGGYSVDLPANIVPVEVMFTLDTRLSTRGGQAVIYRVETPDVTTVSVEQLGKKLGFEGDAMVMDDGTKIAMFDGEDSDERELVVWTDSGAFEYGYTELEKLYPPEPTGLPSEDEAKVIAYTFLEQADLLPHEYKGLSRFEDETAVIPGGSYSISKGYDGEVVQKPPSYWIVSIPYTIDGTGTTGPGSEIEISIGAGGEVVKLVWPWRDIYSLSTGDILSEEDAFHNLIKGKGSIEVPLGCEEVIVRDVTLAYWINAPSEEQDYVLPVYRFGGKCLGSRGETLEDFIAWTEALTGSY